MLPKLSIGVLSVIALLLGALYTNNKTSSSINLIVGTPLLSTQLSGDQFPLTLTDATGYSHTLIAPPQRVASTVLAADEILTELIPTSRLIAVTHLVDEVGISNVTNFYPPHIKRIRAEIESILALQPDLVIVASYTEAVTIRLLLASDIPVLRLQAQQTFAGLKENITLLGKVLNANKQAQQLNQSIDKRLDNIQHNLKNAPSFTTLYFGPGGASAGLDTIMDASINLIGSHNLLQDVNLKGYNNISVELAIGLQPEVIIVSASYGENENQWQRKLLNDPLWQQVPAVKNQRVYSIPAAWLSSASQYRVNGVEALAAKVHGNLFKTPINKPINQ